MTRTTAVYVRAAALGIACAALAGNLVAAFVAAIGLITAAYVTDRLSEDEQP